LVGGSRRSGARGGATSTAVSFVDLNCDLVHVRREVFDGSYIEGFTVDPPGPFTVP